MATSGILDSDLKKPSEDDGLKKTPGKGKLAVGEAAHGKPSWALGNSHRIEARSEYIEQLKGTGCLTSSHASALKEELQPADISQTVKTAVLKQSSQIGTSEKPSIKQALRGETFSQASENYAGNVCALKKTSRCPGSSQAFYAPEIPTSQQAFRGMGCSQVSETGEKLTLKQAFRGVSFPPSSEGASDREESRGAEERDTKKEIPSVAVTSQALESAIGKQQSDGTRTSQKLEVGSFKTLRGEDSSYNAFGGGSLKGTSFFGTSLPLASGTAQTSEGACQLPECKSSSSLEGIHSQYNKWICEPEKECVWDSSLPPSGSFSPQSSIDGNGIVTGTSSVKNSSSANIIEAIMSEEKFSAAKHSESTKPSERGDSVESAKSSVSRGSNSSGVSDDSTWSSLTAGVNKPHKANDPRWESILAIRKRDGILGLSHFRLLKRLGCGDIGSVYLSELSGTKCYFAMKVMDKASLASRKKLLRAQTEREILQLLDHPFLPTLYTHFETDKFSCLVMEFCPGGDLHTLRQRQPGKHFTELAARFYAAEVLLGLEYLHMLGVVYRDLKPENVLVREDGHIMLSDFDLSLRCAVSPTLVKSSSVDHDPSKRVPAYCVQPACIEPSCVQPVCVQPSCAQPSCFVPRLFTQRSKKGRKPKTEVGTQVTPLPELVAEPTNARSMSFVGTHEYLAPEIIKGEGHGSAVDWWTFGIFLHELIFGKTPFKGSGNRATLFNVVGQPLRFPDSPTASFAARDLIRGLLVKEPQHRLAYKRGATEIKQHPFFEGMNWALIRCTTPPEIPKPFENEFLGKTASTASTSGKKIADSDQKSSGNYLDFEFF